MLSTGPSQTIAARVPTQPAACTNLYDGQWPPKAASTEIALGTRPSVFRIWEEGNGAVSHGVGEGFVDHSTSGAGSGLVSASMEGNPRGAASVVEEGSGRKDGGVLAGASSG